MVTEGLSQSGGFNPGSGSTGKLHRKAVDLYLRCDQERREIMKNMAASIPVIVATVVLRNKRISLGLGRDRWLAEGSFSPAL